MGAEKSRLDNSSLQIHFEGDARAFDANNSIMGHIEVRAGQAIPAYGIQLKLELIDMSKEVDYGDKGQRYPYIWKRRAWEKVEILKCFDNNICNAGTMQIPFSFQVPADLPQSFYFVERWHEVRFKLRYFFKAQIVPVSADMLNNEWGKSKIRDRQRVHISPVRPIVNDPQFNVSVPFSKKVGLVGKKFTNMSIMVAKSFYLAGEIAYFMVDIDNSQCGDACQLEIAHISIVQMYQSWRRFSVKRTHTKQKYWLAGPGEHKQIVLQFQIGSKRKSTVGTGFFGKHAQDYYNLNTLVPETVFAQTFSCTNYLELHLNHNNTLFSNDATNKFYFQLIQPSLVPGVVEPPPPIFLDVNGQIMNMENPVIMAPEGEVIQGEAVDIPDEDKKGKVKEVKEEEEGEETGKPAQ